MLTDITCRRAKAQEKAYKLSDDRGLYLFVMPTGSKSWRMKYRFSNKEKRLTFGLYPEVSLSEARERRDAARQLIRQGRDPSVVAKQRAAELALSAGSSFRAVAESWHAVRKSKWKPRYAAQILERLENHAFPTIGSMPVTEVTPALVLALVRTIEASGALEMAHRVRQHLSDIFVFAIASGWAADDPSHVIRKALVSTSPARRPAVTSTSQGQNVLRAIEETDCYAVTKLASRLLALTAARPGVVRMAEPQEFEGLAGAEPVWRIPAAKMKLTRERRIDVAYEFVIPLSQQAVDVVRTAIELAGPGATYLFHSVRSRKAAISDNTLSKAYRDAGWQGRHVPHGWRATFSTVMNELAAGADRDEERAIIDLMLAHLPNGVEAAYNRASYMPRRRRIAQEWADMLMDGMSPAAELAIGRRGTSPRAMRARRRHETARGQAPGSPTA